MITVNDLTDKQLTETARNLFKYDPIWRSDYHSECAFKNYCIAEDDIFSANCCRYGEIYEDQKVLDEALRQAEIDAEWQNAPVSSVGVLLAIATALIKGPKPKPINLVEFVSVGLGGTGGDAA